MFVAYVVQKGEGCDYTIGCAQTLWKLKAGTRPEAIQELRDSILGEYFPEEEWYDGGYWGDEQLGEVTLYEVANEEEIPISQWYSDAIKIEKQGKARRTEARERAEFERLRIKYS